MRLKNSDGPLAFHNGNNDIINSPKRINTIQNSNVTANYNNTTNISSTTNNYTNSYDNSINSNLTTTDVITNVENQSTTDLNILNQVVHDKVQWCKPSQEVQNRTLFNNNANNRNNQLVNINNTLAATIRQVRHGTASSICSESSPDDSLLDFEEAQPSCSSTDTTPQDEDRAFDISDSESEDGNLSNRGTLQRRGITNPNYPGFQHFAYSLNFRTTPDPELTDDDIECDTFTKFQEEANNNNINETDYKIDSVNRLDSIENIQKVFYDKTLFNVDEESELNQISDSCSRSSNQSDEDSESNIDLNIRIEEKTETHEDIVGDLSREIEDELEKVDLGQNLESGSLNPLRIVNAEVEELKEAVENLQVMKDLQSPITKFNIEPNIANNFDKLSPTKQLHLHQVYEDSVVVKNIPYEMNLKMEAKIVDAFLSNAKENISPMLPRQKSFVELLPSFETKMEVEQSSRKPELHRKDSNREVEVPENRLKKMKLSPKKPETAERFFKEDVLNEEKEKEDGVAPRKKEKVELPLRKRKDPNQQVGSWITVPRREPTNRNKDLSNRRSVPLVKEKKKTANLELLGGFDVYNIETALPKIDLEAIESHLRAAHEEDRRRRTDREEIRRRLAMGCEDDYFTDRPGRKPSLQARLQSGMNLQICFMNESLSDTDSPSSDSECPMTNPKQPKTASPKNNTLVNPYLAKPSTPAARPATLSLGQAFLQPPKEPTTETDFFTKQARLQTEARMALAQAKEMARMQMEIERQRQKKSPITEMIRHSLEKVGIPFPEEKRRLSRQLLTEMNVAQLQVIVNDLHTQIETLNENLVKFLMDRDDLHMEQDSMLVDIEDLTRYLGAKEQVLKEQNLGISKLNNNTTPPSPAPSSPLSALNSSVKPHLHRIANLVKK